VREADPKRVAGAAAVLVGLLIGLIAARMVVPHRPHLDPIERSLRAAVTAPARADSDLAAFYRARGYRPLWLDGRRPRPEAFELIGLLRGATQDGLSPQDYAPDALDAATRRARSGDPAALASAELGLSRALAAYVADLHQPPKSAALVFDDPALKRPPTEGAVLAEAGRAASLHAYLASARAVNPVYDQLRDEMASYSGGQAGLIRANLERARVLPANLGKRYILVNAAAQRLWFYEDGQVKGSMRVVVGKRDEQTPVMAGVIRYAIFNPYWNVPPDLVRDRFAPQVLHKGLSFVADQRMEALSDWSPRARVLDPKAVDWAAVAAGRQALRLRQRPGPENMMGSVKFMLPNPLGVYLHDTPKKALFSENTRAFSAGCVRLGDPTALSQWLFGRPIAAPPGAAGETRVNLPAPVPVYIVYLTAAPGPKGPVFSPDIYGRDPALLAQLEHRHRLAG
jgi:murein L,D-transpeptidase YcbB/YkuD